MGDISLCSRKLVLVSLLWSLVVVQSKLKLRNVLVAYFSLGNYAGLSDVIGAASPSGVGDQFP